MVCDTCPAPQGAPHVCRGCFTSYNHTSQLQTHHQHIHSFRSAGGVGPAGLCHSRALAPNTYNTTESATWGYISHTRPSSQGGRVPSHTVLSSDVALVLPLTKQLFGMLLRCGGCKLRDACKLRPPETHNTVLLKPKDTQIISGSASWARRSCNKHPQLGASHMPAQRLCCSVAALDISCGRQECSFQNMPQHQGDPLHRSSWLAAPLRGAPPYHPQQHSCH
jgi:hypothetical protein